MFKTSAIFKENLEQFPSTDHIKTIEIYQDGKPVANIQNVDGQKGSIALYYYLYKSMGVLDIYAARRGLELYAEHTADARLHPGKHPNIDRLIFIEACNKSMEMKLIYTENHVLSDPWEDERDEHDLA